jgi:hypothetical protein
MEQLIEFQFEATRYTVWRQGEWAFFASVAMGEGDSVHLDVDLMDRELACVLSPRRFPLTLDEGMCLRMHRPDGGHDDVTVGLDEVKGARAILAFELPEGVQMELLQEPGRPSAE